MTYVRTRLMWLTAELLQRRRAIGGTKEDPQQWNIYEKTQIHHLLAWNYVLSILGNIISGTPVRQDGNKLPSSDIVVGGSSNNVNREE